ncbi:pro-sigmaK processing inhibitor BofA family protein [Paenibacillus alkaliterrae]|uniref:pro-sigmaK processing inhibitor BofA family protein n=1 Tax=Paenibacillus alkaliterrae TaxID=320909 RepID=UPI001F1C534A|nr:pro-sigmaK processing inhibitor BofA family protein [Paenibacillus alkaliterrae]MCF2941407.1 pro-sigmaK processing inhibitor BofA family protein [Paenibacillus alkaliterrae]
MRAVWLSIFIASSVLLIAVVLRNKLSWSWLRGFSLHLVLAAALLYVLNYSNLIPDMYIPINPVTIGTVVTLGIPGVALIVGLQWAVV